MRLRNRELGLSGRLGFLKLGIVGGLLALLMLVAVGCNDAEPNATVESTVPTSPAFGARGLG